MVFVDPVGNCPVVRIGNEQRQCEASQDAFGGAFPLGVFGADLDEFADEG